jgi:protein involved in polysaccharide export with SLBB domain
MQTTAARGSFWVRARSGVAALVAALAAAVAGLAFGQVPIPLQEQIELFNTLPPAQQQALIREMQRNLPPAQRQAIIEALTGDQAASTDAEEVQIDPGEIEGLIGAAGDAANVELDSPNLEPGNWLALELTRRIDAVERTAGLLIQSLDELQRRLENENPYQLDDDGRLLLPGVPPIALGGLTPEEATVRLRTEPTLRGFDIALTKLPIAPAGIDALEPYGYGIFEDALTTFRRTADVPVPIDYVIGPGDTLNIQLFGSQNEEYFLTVTREGTVAFPEIGPINVSGLSFAEARTLLTTRVTEQMIGVRASVTLGELRSIRVFVLGDVEQPGSYTISGLATMTNALLESGGVKEIGSLRNVRLMRDGATIGDLDLYALVLRGDTTADARLQPGDVIFVPPVGPQVAVAGEVRRPAIYELRGERSIADVIALAGGYTPSADRSRVKLERLVPNRGLTVEDLDLSRGAASGVVREGDTIRVQRNLDQLESAVRLVGNVHQPGNYQWTPGMRLTDLIRSPELVRPRSDLSYVLIRREIAPNVDVEVFSADLRAIWDGAPGANNVALQSRDTVYVFDLESGRQQLLRPIIEELEAQVGSNEPDPVVSVDGQVRAVGTYPLESGMRVSDLVRAGGGLSEAAYPREAELTRYAVVDGQYRETELMMIDLTAALRGDPAANVAIAPYDRLSIKEVPRWQAVGSIVLHGEVVFPGIYSIRNGETLSSVLQRAGGLSDQAFAGGSVFTRVGLREKEREQLDTLARRIESELATLSLADQGSNDVRSIGQGLLTQLRSTVPTGRFVIKLDEVIAGNPAADILLRDGDELFVPVLTQEVTVLGEVQYATSHVYQRGLERDEYINRSGGLTRRADEDLIYVVRANGEVVADSSGGKWFRRGGSSDILPGDTVVVPQDVDRVRPLARWSAVTSVVYNLAIAAAAVNSF